MRYGSRRDLKSDDSDLFLRNGYLDVMSTNIYIDSLSVRVRTELFRMGCFMHSHDNIEVIEYMNRLIFKITIVADWLVAFFGIGDVA